jgi:hypothetical protein
MTQTLDHLLESDRPVDLEAAEKALAACEARDPDLEAALTVLIWRRRVEGRRGLVESLIRTDCLARLDRIPGDLERVGARDAAAAFRKLRRACPLSDAQLGPGLIDWLDTNPPFAEQARDLERDLDDVGPRLCAFLADRREACARVPLPPERRGVFARWFG